MHDLFFDTSKQLLATLPVEPDAFGIRGALGDALFACEQLARRDPRLDAAPWVERAVDLFNREGCDATLHNGLAGLGMVLSLYTDTDTLADIDAALVDHLPGLPPASLQSGIAGVGVYASVRSDAPSGRALQRAVVDAFAATAAPWKGGVVWHTPAAYARAREMDVPREPVTELGLVHGVGGALVALAALARQGHEDAGALARAGLRALWTFEASAPNHFGHVFFGPPEACVSREVKEPARCCMGDIGVLRCAFLAADAIGDGPSAARARDRLGALARGPTPAASAIHDLCCGTAAAAQVYWRMFEATGDPHFFAAHARAARECAVAVETTAPRDFAYGRMGLLLAAESASGGVDPAWDAILGLRLPPRGLPSRRSPAGVANPAAAPVSISSGSTWGPTRARPSPA